MAKLPVLGSVKTRLAREIGAVEAARFYRSAVRTVVGRLARDRRWRTILAIAPDAGLRAHVWPPGPARIGQGRGDLGARMQRLLASASGSGPVVLIGTDIPGVAPGHIAQAFARLGGHDAVFGPAEDGGYWLVGLRRCPRLLRPFAGVRWSSPHALADTVANLARARVAMVATLSDVDTAHDHARLGPVAAQLIAPLSRISEKRPRGFRQ